MKWEEKTCGHTKKKKEEEEAKSESTLVETLKLPRQISFSLDRK
jgi:hypothetical protein